MKKYWDEATFVLETLVMIAAGQDKDGSDLRFTLGSQRLNNEKSSASFKAAMLRAKPGENEVTDIRQSLGEIFESYLHALRSFNMGRGRRAKALTLIILTDGLWEGVQEKSRINGQIVEFISRMKKITDNVVERRVSIQFIQFGKDQDATKRLTGLDNDLIKWGVP